LAGRPAEMAKVSSAVPTDPALAALFDFFQNTASQDNLVLKRASLGQMVLVLERPLIEKRTVNLEISGAYADFKKLILSLEKSSRLIRLESLAFTLPSQGDSLLFNLTASVNYLPLAPTTATKSQ